MKMAILYGGNMLLNKQILTKAIKESITDDARYWGEKPSTLKNVDELHDEALTSSINNINIEEYDAMYYEMLSLLNTDGEEILEEINDFIDEEFQTYYGDPAFASAYDYWNYILGRFK